MISIVIVSGNVHELETNVQITHTHGDRRSLVDYTCMISMRFPAHFVKYIHIGNWVQFRGGYSRWCIQKVLTPLAFEHLMIAHRARGSVINAIHVPGMGSLLIGLSYQGVTVLVLKFLIFMLDRRYIGWLRNTVSWLQVGTRGWSTEGVWLTISSNHAAFLFHGYLHITLPHYHYYADLPEGIEVLKCLSDIFCLKCVSKIWAVLWDIFYAIYGTMCIHLTYSSYDDCENTSTWSYYPHQIGSMTHLSLFRARSWNNCMHRMSFYILTVFTSFLYQAGGKKDGRLYVCH